MVCSGVLGFILLFLLHPALGILNLKNIINYLHQKYGNNNQYALGINVPDTYCNVDADPDQNFLSKEEDAQKVINAMNGHDKIYNGCQLIGARPKPIRNTKNNYHSEYQLLDHSMSNKFRQYDPLMKTLLNSNPNNFLSQDKDEQKVENGMNGSDKMYKGVQLIGARQKPNKRTNNYHSEYLLLINSTSDKFRRFDPLMQTLLNSKPNGCAVFFTLNSPCVQTCSTPNGNYSIIPALDMFNNHKGPKAFVFREIWQHDVGTTNWKRNILEINQRIPLYRCTANECVPCVNNNVVDDKCS